MLPADQTSVKICDVVNVADGFSHEVKAWYSQGIGFCGKHLLKQIAVASLLIAKHEMTCLS